MFRKSFLNKQNAINNFGYFCCPLHTCSNIKRITRLLHAHLVISIARVCFVWWENDANKLCSGNCLWGGHWWKCLAKHGYWLCWGIDVTCCRCDISLVRDGIMLDDSGYFVQEWGREIYWDGLRDHSTVYERQTLNDTAERKCQTSWHKEKHSERQRDRDSKIKGSRDVSCWPIVWQYQSTEQLSTDSSQHNWMNIIIQPIIHGK